MTEHNMNMGETLVQIRIELGILGEKMDQMKDLHREVKVIGDIAKKTEQRITVSEDRIKGLEDDNTWLWRSALGGLILGAIGLGFTIITTYLKGG